MSLAPRSVVFAVAALAFACKSAPPAPAPSGSASAAAAAALATTATAAAPSASAPTTHPLARGDKAPAFALAGSDGKTHALADHAGKDVVVVAWFPKAFTGG
jgi:hypothetical protein